MQEGRVIKDFFSNWHTLKCQLIHSACTDLVEKDDDWWLWTKSAVSVASEWYRSHASLLESNNHHSKVCNFCYTLLWSFLLHMLIFWMALPISRNTSRTSGAAFAMMDFNTLETTHSPNMHSTIKKNTSRKNKVVKYALIAGLSLLRSYSVVLWTLWTAWEYYAECSQLLQ